MHVLKDEQFLPITLDEGWSFLSDPKNLSRITPEKMNFVILSDLPDKVYPGLMILYKVHPVLGIPLTWLTEITHVQEPNYFVDEQRLGPYSLWHHEHHLKETTGGIIMQDIVHYKLPFGLIGKMVDWVMVKKQLREIFSYRRKKLEEIFM